MFVKRLDGKWCQTFTSILANTEIVSAVAEVVLVINCHVMPPKSSLCPARIG